MEISRRKIIKPVTEVERVEVEEISLLVNRTLNYDAVAIHLVEWNNWHIRVGPHKV